MELNNMKKAIMNKNGLTVVDMSAEEISAREVDITKFAERKTANAIIETKKSVDAKAGNDKLIALGLTQDQVTAMTGYVLPSVQYQKEIDAGNTPEEATAITGYTPE
jgi:hypothetical protein